ncbi:hypothetical protein GCM10008985_22870 [Halococcus dombrowskii]|uniref:Cox cluster protein n=1 Tax=Halococcus dombrowskii TaxID=179637 RepID=A0AAV3SIS9_HALDO
MSSLDTEEIIDIVEDQRKILLAALFPLALFMLFISQSGIPIIPIPATVILLAGIAAYYLVLFIENIDV